MKKMKSIQGWSTVEGSLRAWRGHPKVRLEAMGAVSHAGSKGGGFQEREGQEETLKWERDRKQKEGWDGRNGVIKEERERMSVEWKAGCRLARPHASL